MDRLTKRGTDRDAFVIDQYGNSDCHNICHDATDCTNEGCVLHAALNRLAAYEDTGLTVEEISAQLEHIALGTRGFVKRTNEDNARLRADLERVTAEKDAAVSDLRYQCRACFRKESCGQNNGIMNLCCTQWEWRGPEKEENNA